MSMFYLMPDAHGTDLECPRCHVRFNVIWYTEYGDPIHGEHEIECPPCGHEFTMLVKIGVTISAIPRRQK